MFFFYLSQDSTSIFHSFIWCDYYFCYHLLMVLLLFRLYLCYYSCHVLCLVSQFSALALVFSTQCLRGWWKLWAEICQMSKQCEWRRLQKPNRQTSTKHNTWWHDSLFFVYMASSTLSFRVSYFISVDFCLNLSPTLLYQWCDGIESIPKIDIARKMQMRQHHTVFVNC